MALGCSTNTALHLAAVAHEAGVPFSVQLINEISKVTPNLCHLAPAGHHHMQDLNAAGGVHAVMAELAGSVCLTPRCRRSPAQRQRKPRRRQGQRP
jgi:dihydroxyacid dehydratase/phosphogluconate dehydratase